MSLPLHTIVTRDEALAGLTGGAPPEVLRGGEFATAPGLVLGFLRPAALTFRSPTTIEWGPGETRDPPPWMLAPPRRPLPKYHLLLEEPGGWFYAGDAHLGSYRTDGSEATFTLSAPLPRGAWVRLGGYPHWLVELNHEEHRLGPDEEAKLRALLRRVIAPPHGHLTLTRYEEDSLQLYTNLDRGWLMYLRTPDDSGSYVATGDEDEDEGREDANDVSEHFRCDCGIDLDLPRSQTLPVIDAADVVIDFFRSGKRPASVTWE